MRQSLLTLLISSSLFLSLSPADARTLSPTSDWSVNKISATQGDAYCTMARQYEADSVITFARNASGEGTIALDFQRNVFDVTRPYPIILQSGSVLRQYVIKPANNTAIIMRTSTDASLFEAMSQTGKLRVQIDSENFTVDLKDYAAGFEKLNQCIGRGKAATVVAEVKAPRSPKSMVNQVDNQESLTRQDSQISELVNENARLVRELESERTSFRQNLATTENDRGLMRKLAAAESKNADLLRRVSTLETQLSSRSARLNPDVSAALKERETQMDLLRGEKSRLQSLLDEERAKRVALELEVQKLKANGAQFSNSANPLNTELEKQVANLTAQNQRLRDQLSSAGVSGSTIILNERLAEAETVAISLKAERDEYRSLLQRERQRLKEISDLGQGVSSAQASSQNMIAEIQQLEAEKVDLIRQLEFAKTGASPVDTQMSSNDSALQKRLEIVTQESEKAKQELRIIAADKKALEEKLRAAEFEMTEAKRALSNAKVNRMVTGDKNNEIQILESEIASLEAQNRILREDMASKTNTVSVDRSETSAMLEVLEEKYQKRFDAMERENIRLTQELYKTSNKVDVRRAIQPMEDKITEEPMEVAKVEQLAPEVVEQRVTPSEARRQLRNKITGKAVSPAPAMVKTAMASVPSQQPVKMVAAGQVARQLASQPVMTALSGDDIRRLVSQSQIPLVSNIERVSNISGPDFAAFRWDTGEVYGSAEQSRLANERAFENAVNQYISKTQSRCSGEFDKTLIPVATSNGLNARAADIACIQGSDGAAASIVFFSHGGMFYALAHEADLNSFQVAMDHRDQLVTNLSQIF